MADLVDVARAQKNNQLSSVDASTLEIWISAASAFVEGVTGRTFASAEATEIYDGGGEASMLLDRFPITAVEEVIITSRDGTTETIAGTEFDYNARLGLIQFAYNANASTRYFPKGFQNISVKYTAGWTTVPADIQEAVVQIIANLSSDASQDQNVVSEKLGQYAVTYKQSSSGGGSALSGFSKFVRTTLARYRDVRIGL